MLQQLREEYERALQDHYGPVIPCSCGARCFLEDSGVEGIGACCGPIGGMIAYASGEDHTLGYTYGMRGIRMGISISTLSQHICRRHADHILDMQASKARLAQIDHYFAATASRHDLPDIGSN